MADKDTRCRYIVDRYSTSRSRPAHRCSKESVDGYFCARHVDTDEADMYRAHLALVEPKAPEEPVFDKGRAEADYEATRHVCANCGTKHHDPARLDRNPSGWCDACIMATAKAPGRPVKDRSSSAAAAAVRNVMIATGRR